MECFGRRIGNSGNIKGLWENIAIIEPDAELYK